MAGFRFAFMADCQLGCYATFSGMGPDDIAGFAARGMHVRPAPAVEGFAWDAERYRVAVAQARRADVAFAVMGGDMVDDPASAEQRQAVMEITAGLGRPMHWVPGNHDASADTSVPTEGSLHRYREAFGPDQYSFEHLDVTFVVVDTVVWQHPELVQGEYDRQLAALRATLETARAAGRRLIVFGHHPLFTRTPDEPEDYWNIPLVRRGVILDLLATSCVRTFFCGHWHRNGGGRFGELEVAVTGPVGYPLGADPSGFRLVEVDDGAIRHRYVPLDGGWAG